MLLLPALAACVSGRAPNGEVSALYVPPSSYDFTQNQKLLERILATPHGYFRFVNVPFSEEVCRRFSDVIDEVPIVNLHGDAHLEQYAITDLGRGLTDFDDSSVGPGLIDLMRLGVSLQLTARALGWADDAERLYMRFLEGYRAALEEPEAEAPRPRIAGAIRDRFEFDREKYFEWIDSIMQEVPKEEQQALVDAMSPYVENMRAQNPELDARFFEVAQIGYLKMGIGSALDLKYLVRVRGPTDAPEDDVVLEVKEVRDLSGIRCIQSAKDTDAFRILVGQSRIAYRPYEYLGYVRFQGKTFWIHSWVDNYKELKSPSSFEGPEDLAEVVYDIGIQLGRGHPNKIAAPLDLQLRRAQLRMLDKHQARLAEECRKLADETEAAWKRFKESAGEKS